MAPYCYLSAGASTREWEVYACNNEERSAAEGDTSIDTGFSATGQLEMLDRIRTMA